MIARMKDDRRAAGKSKMRSRGAQALAAGCAVLVLVIPGTAGATSLRPAASTVNLTWETMWSGPTLLPVSYTHLDVYKRQSSAWS